MFKHEHMHILCLTHDHYLKNAHLYRSVTLICTEYWTGTGSPVQMMGSICTGRDTWYKCLTFVLGGVPARYKCPFPPPTWGGGAFVPVKVLPDTNILFLFSFIFLYSSILFCFLLYFFDLTYLFNVLILILIHCNIKSCGI
jgi:hypothetical protein